MTAPWLGQRLVPGDGHLDDPAGLDPQAVRPIRDEIRRRVEQLFATLEPAAA